jgi:uroporphyrinogen decarboxylase
MQSKELVKRAVTFKDPERIPVVYPYDFEASDVVGVEVVDNFQGLDKRHSEWGFTWEHFDNDLTMGQVKEPLIKEWPDLDRYTAPDPGRADRFGPMKAARAKYGDGKYYRADLGLSGFTVMAFLRGFPELLEDLYLERERVERLADVVFGFEEEVIRRLKPQGFDAVAFFDDWGTQKDLFISPALWREVFKPRYRRQVELSHACGLQTYFHCCGKIFDIIPDFIDIGLDILNPGQPNINGIRRMGESFSGKICFACPVSYQTTGITGSREDIRREVREMVDCLGNRGGGLIGIVAKDIIGLGGTQENIRAIFDAFSAGRA